MTDDHMTELQETGRTYVPFSFGDDLAILVPQILAGTDTLGIDEVSITLAGSNTLLVAVPGALHVVDPDGEEG